MSSLRKRVSSYFRQLSFHNDPKERKSNINENSFVTKYLQGRIPVKEAPVVLYGKNPTDLPNYDLGQYEMGAESIAGCYTGPQGGLTTVKRTEKHLSITDPDIDYIDTQEETACVEVQKSPARNESAPSDGSTMVIKVAGQTYHVPSAKKQHNKSHSLGSLSDFNLDIDKPKKYSSTGDNNAVEDAVITNNDVCKRNSEQGDVVSESCGGILSENGDASHEEAPSSFALAKSKSEGNPFSHKRKGKIIKITERPRGETTEPDSGILNIPEDTLLPTEWNQKSNHIYGVSDSLYDKNQVTKHKNGDPIADCFGIIARNDSAILALADGVNWGEKACIAAKSAVHGCLHYLNQTIFNDTKPFQSLVKNQTDTPPNFHDSKSSLTEHCINNTRDVFVCLLRAFNCAHDLILENKGMLTTLTVAVVLPINKSSNNRRLFEKYGRRSSVNNCDFSELEDLYICCVCNVGDTLAYVYSQSSGIRELTKGSHDISANRDMRDALGALGPVDGINPELSNLTLSITPLKKGDIVLIASDGLTDNFDPNVCRFTTNLPEPKKKPSVTQKDPPTVHHKPQEVARKNSLPRYEKVEPIEKLKPPIKPPRKNIKNRDSASRSSTEKSISDRDSAERTSRKSHTISAVDNNNELLNNNKDHATNPLIAQFLRDNPVETRAKPSQQRNSLETKRKPAPTSHSSSKHAASSSHQQTRAKSTHSMPSSRKAAAPRSADVKRSEKSTIPAFLRSKTTLDMKSKPVLRDEEGIPYVNPIQRYELTLLLIEDILKRGISGNETQCVTSRKLCENLVSFTFSITSAKRRTLEDLDLYFDNRNGVLVEVSAQEKKIRRRRGLDKVQNLPGKLDHVSVVAYNVGNCS